jgi:hypothetical protein
MKGKLSRKVKNEKIINKDGRIAESSSKSDLKAAYKKAEHYCPGAILRQAECT